MKKRKLLTDIFTVVLMVAIVLVLLSYLGVFPGDNTEPGTLAHTMLLCVGMPLALLSVAMIDIVFPAIDNRKLFKTTPFVIKFIVKLVLFVLAVAFGVIYFGLQLLPDMNQFFGVAIFCVLYFAQFLINLDPKKPRQQFRHRREMEEQEEMIKRDENIFLEDAPGQDNDEEPAKEEPKAED